MTIHFPRRHCVKKILLLTDVTVNNCAWNYVISLNEKILYIGRKTMQTMRVYFDFWYYIGCIVGGAWQGVS